MGSQWNCQTLVTSCPRNKIFIWNCTHSLLCGWPSHMEQFTSSTSWSRQLVFI